MFAAATVGRGDVPTRLRSLLNIKSGLNDGLDLPVVLILVGALGGMPPGESTELGPRLGEGGLGLLLWVVVPLAGVALVAPARRRDRTTASPAGPGRGGGAALRGVRGGRCEPLPRRLRGRHHPGHGGPEGGGDLRRDELISELAKNFALLAFGVLVTREILGSVGFAGWVLAALVLLLGRPLENPRGTVDWVRLTRSDRGALRGATGARELLGGSPGYYYRR